MKKILITIFLLLQSACVYANIKIPLDRDVLKTELGTKQGVASNHTVLWLVSWGNAGTMEAARNGNIQVINHLDMGVKSYLFGAYSRTDTIAYGD